jgi:hypothetical protein
MDSDNANLRANSSAMMNANHSMISNVQTDKVKTVGTATREYFGSLFSAAKLVPFLLFFVGYFYRRQWLALRGASTLEFPIDIWAVPMYSLDFLLTSTVVFGNHIVQVPLNSWIHDGVIFVCALIMPFLFAVFVGKGINRKHRALRHAAAVALRQWQHSRFLRSIPRRVLKSKWLAKPLMALKVLLSFVTAIVIPPVVTYAALIVGMLVISWLHLPVVVATKSFELDKQSMASQLNALNAGSNTANMRKLYFLKTINDPGEPLMAPSQRVQIECGQSLCITAVYEKATGLLKIEKIPANTVTSAIEVSQPMIKK